MNQKTVGWGVALVIVLIIIALVVYWNGSRAAVPENANAGAEAAVEETVVGFGSALSMVSLLAPVDDVAISMEENYASYVAPELLAQWESDPTHAPGRLTSSPAPDHIEIVSVQTNADGTYTVIGNVVETANTDTASTTVAAGTYPVALRLENRDGSWLIVGFQGYPPKA